MKQNINPNLFLILPSVYCEEQIFILASVICMAHSQLGLCDLGPPTISHALFTSNVSLLLADHVLA